RVAKPAYAQSKGPRVAIDEAHFNFHTLSGRYQPFAELLRRDGYPVEASAAPFAEASLRGIRILVIANALGERNKDEENWSLPRQSAFTATEIAAVVQWVKRGGGLLLIVDHMPFPGAAAQLARGFGLQFSDGFVWEEREYSPPDIFERSTG